MYGDLISKMAARLDVSTSQPTHFINYVVFSVIQAQLYSMVPLSLTRVMAQAACFSWDKHRSAPVISKSLDYINRIQEDSAEFLFPYPQLNSTIISSALKDRQHHCTPPDQECKKIRLLWTPFLLIGSVLQLSCLHSKDIHAIFNRPCRPASS